MHRRNFVAALATCIPLACLAKSKDGVVETLQHTSTDSKYVEFKRFSTEEDAIAFVQSLTPELIGVELLKDAKTSALISGYRGAVRHIEPNSIVRSYWRIVSKQKDGTFIPVYEITDEASYSYLYDCARCWAFIENLRVNGKPVHYVTKSNLPVYMIQPFRKADKLAVNYI